PQSASTQLTLKTSVGSLDKVGVTLRPSRRVCTRLPAVYVCWCCLCRTIVMTWCRQTSVKRSLWRMTWSLMLQRIDSNNSDGNRQWQ
ncbi:unnamed protein product, partial [Ceratitis capitata]